MSKKPVAVSPEAAAKNEAFLKDLKATGTTRYIKRHSLQARITHDVTVIMCLLLVASGLFVFIPPLANAVGGEVTFACRMAHRAFGAVFIAVPLISAILAPKGVAHIVKTNVCKWDSDDKKWMALFMPYLFMAKRLHMPDQHESKSGQRFADGMLWLLCFLMAITGVLLCLVEPLGWDASVRGVCLFLHDLGFFGLCVFGMAHIFLGAGIFQPYRGTHRLMFGDGKISESDALYHWAHWAREEIESGEKVVRGK